MTLHITSVNGDAADNQSHNYHMPFQVSYQLYGSHNNEWAGVVYVELTLQIYRHLTAIGARGAGQIQCLANAGINKLEENKEANAQNRTEQKIFPHTLP
jgi:hypothetical protein